MTLMERVETAQAEGAGRALFTGDAWMLDELKDEVSAIIPGNVLASLSVDNPKRARSELKRAIRSVYSTAKWSARSADAKERLQSDLLDTVFGLGPLQPFVEDAEVTEIMVNGIDSVFVEKGGRIEGCGPVFVDAMQVRALIDRILAPLGRRVDESSPMVDARLPNGHRVNIVIPPVALDGPVITIRKFTARAMTLEEMAERRSFDRQMASFLSWAVRSRKNIAVCGGTGSGKTTLLNALSCEVSGAERIVTIEDSAELRFTEHPHVVRLESRSCNAEGMGEVSIRDLVRNALRMRPDRIIVGECRGAEALDMLQAMNTGHDGSLTTLHANSPADMVMRLVTMVRYGVDLPVDVVERNIASALDVVVQVARSRDGRRFISDVAFVEAGDAADPCLVRAAFERRDSFSKGSWLCFPSWIDELADQGIAKREEVELWKKACI